MPDAGIYALFEDRDGEWIKVGTRRVAYYTNIPPGRYTFRVQASNNHGVWNEEGASLSIALAPFFYETLWFYMLSGLLLVLLGYAGYWQRTRSIRTRNAKLAAFNAMLNQEVKERKHAEDLLEAKNEELEVQIRAVPRPAMSSPSALGAGGMRRLPDGPVEHLCLDRLVPHPERPPHLESPPPNRSTRLWISWPDVVCGVVVVSLDRLLPLASCYGRW